MEEGRPRRGGAVKGPRSRTAADARFTQRRAEILRAAAVCFHRHGYHGTSVEDIARELRMTKGNLYYYFEDKEEILFFCHDYSLDLLLALTKRVRAEAKAPDARLRLLIEAFVHMILDELHGTALTLEFQALSPPLLAKVIKKRDRFDRSLREVLKEGMARRVFAPGDPKLLAFAILGAVNWITRWFDPKGPATSEEIGRTFADYLLNGLRFTTEKPADPRSPRGGRSRR
jgi:TetR/AcrR family transcriptional regulator